MKRRWWLVVAAVLLCLSVAGVVWVRADDDVPSRLENPGLVDPYSMHTAECTVTWAADSDVCKGQGPGNCLTVYQGSFVSLFPLEDVKAYCEMAYGVGRASGAVSCDACR